MDDKHEFKQGHLEPFWGTEYKDLKYHDDREFPYEERYRYVSEERAAELERDYDFYHSRTTWYEDVPWFDQQIIDVFTEELQINDPETFYLAQDPKTVVPFHYDSCFIYCEKLKELGKPVGNELAENMSLVRSLDFKNIYNTKLANLKTTHRAVLFLEDHQPGQSFVVEDHNEEWKAGDWMAWKNPITIHEACNDSDSVRHIVTITGWK